MKKPDMGKHTVSGEPVGQKHDAEREEKEQHERHDDYEGDDGSVLSDDPDNSAAEDVGKDVGSGLHRFRAKRHSRHRRPIRLHTQRRAQRASEEQTANEIHP